MTVMRTITFILSVFIVGMVEMMVAGIMNLMSADLHISEAVIGQLITIYAITFAISGPILVKLTERYSPRYVLLYTLLVFAIGNLIIAVAPNFTILVIGRILSSAAASLIVVKTLALTTLLTTPQNRGKMLGIVYSGFSGANVLGVPIGTIIGDFIGWRFTFVFIVSVSVLAGVLMLIHLPSVRELNTYQAAAQPVTNDSEKAEAPSRILRPAEVTKYIIITFLLLVANSITFIYINPLMLNSGHSLAFVSVALLINGVAGVIGTSMGGFLSDRFTSKRWLLVAVTCFMISVGILNWFLSLSVTLLIIIFIWNLMQWSTNPAVQSGLIEHVEGDTSQVMSWNMSSLNAGIGVGGMIGGLVVSHLNVFTTTYFSAGIALLALLLVISLKNVRHYQATTK
ncbi:MFS transporter [Staphylococcus auricularis]|uniref:MFS transporter n=1 Tax=Staphylococcus auricularis TaxID=29379 RepID=UPI001248C055|nr:MFS transporter [Staphylococcus auricularis]